MIDKAELEGRMLEAADLAFYEHVLRPLEAENAAGRLPALAALLFRAGFTAGVTWTARLPELLAAIDELDGKDPGVL